MRPEAEELRRCYDLLDLAPNASWDEVTAAGQDLLRVWRPDRFADDPGLRSRAEAKTAAIKAAVERLRCCYETDKGRAKEAAPVVDEKPLPNVFRETFALLFLPLRAVNAAAHFTWRYAFLIVVLLVLLRFVFFPGMPSLGNICATLPFACNAQKMLRKVGDAAPASAGGDNALFKDVDKVFEKVAHDM